MSISIIVLIVAFIFGFFFAIFTALFFIILAKYEHHRNNPKKHNRRTGVDLP